MMRSSNPQREADGPPGKISEACFRRSDGRRAGFTLIEVLVALTVIAFALSAIIRATGVMTGNTAHLKEKTYAHWVAMNRVTELRVTKAWPSVGNSSDDVEMFGQEWRWMQKVSQMAISEHIRQVEVSVIHREGGDEDYPLTRLTAFLLDPALVSQTNPAALWTSNTGGGDFNPNDPNDPNNPNNPNFNPNDPNNPNNDPNNPDNPGGAGGMEGSQQ